MRRHYDAREDASSAPDSARPTARRTVRHGSAFTRTTSIPSTSTSTRRQSGHCAPPRGEGSPIILRRPIRGSVSPPIDESVAGASPSPVTNETCAVSAGPSASRRACATTVRLETCRSSLPGRRCERANARRIRPRWSTPGTATRRSTLAVAYRPDKPWRTSG
jgi:hypothetical protein